MMSAIRFAIRAMRQTDLPAVLGIQALAHPDHYHEPAEALASRLALGETLCMVAEAALSGELLGYAFAHAWAGNPPALHEPLPRIGESDHLFLHDVAVAPAAQGLGVAQALLQAIKQGADGVIRLVAVSDARSYWLRHGFCDAPEVDLHSAYGEAVCMEWFSAA